MPRNPFEMLRKVRKRYVRKLQISPGPENVLIDPSLLLANRTFGVIANKIIESEETKATFYLSASFNNWLFSNNASNSNQEALFFLEEEEGVDLDIVRNFLKENKSKIQTYGINIKQKEEDSELKKQLSIDIDDDLLVNIIYEEWMFLKHKSWVISRTRKTFMKWIDAGAIGVEASIGLINKVVNDTLRKSKEEPQFTDYIRTLYVRFFAKWVAIGGVPTIGLVEPFSGATADSAAGYFLHFDAS